MESILPYRVLDIGDRENPRKIFLSVGEDRIGSYAALSYCWGKSERQRKYLTTDENLKQRQEAVDISTFPKTFTDAIVVCRHLGIRFLWIDSLCIVQGNESDWQTQSERMGDIYSNATLTISAAVGEDSHSGLFVDRDPRKTYPCTLNLQYPNEDGVIGKGAFLACRDLDWPEAAYLDTRGWTFQEKYLSPRNISFFKTEMYWTCASSNASEGLPMGLYPSNNKSDFDKYIKMNAKGALSTQVDMVQKYRWWYRAMEIYSYRIFTHDSDRLMALAGLASIFQRPDDEFLYGLWKSDLVHGLAWRFREEYKETTTDISPTSQIPSWSWLSRPGNIITYSDTDSAPLEVTDSVVSITSYHRSTGSLQPTGPIFIEVLSVEPMTPATNSSASCTSRSLRLRGLVLRVRPTESSIAYNSSSRSSTGICTIFQYALSLTNKICKQFLGIAVYDEPVTKGDNLYCLPLHVLNFIRQDTPIRPGDANSQTQRPFGEISIDELVSMQNMCLELGIGTLPTMTWCAGLISCCRVKEGESLICLLLKIVDAEKMIFRRVGYVEAMDGRLFERLAPITLEII